MKTFLGGTLGVVVGFFLALLLNLSWLAGDPRFDMFWGPPNWIMYIHFGIRGVVPEGVAIFVFVIGMPLWWAFLFLAAFTRRRRVAVVLYSIHVVGGPVARYVLMGAPPEYLLKILDPNLWVAWSPMVVFTVWYFTMAFDIRWREVALRAWVRLRG